MPPVLAELVVFVLAFIGFLTVLRAVVRFLLVRFPIDQDDSEFALADESPGELVPWSYPLHLDEERVFELRSRSIASPRLRRRLASNAFRRVQRCSGPLASGALDTSS